MILTRKFVIPFLFFLISGFTNSFVPARGIIQKKDDTVNIGLLIQDKSDTAAVEGAEIAIRKANQESGLEGHPFKLIVKSMEGPWGTGSKQAVSLVFDDNVWAILGSHDGRNAHLVEQVSAKTRVVYMSAWSGDPTLAQAFIPWYFSCVPNDECQAAAIVQEITVEKKMNRVAVISDLNYDSKSLEKYFIRKAKENGRINSTEFTISNPRSDLTGLADSVYQSHVECIVIFSEPAAISKLLHLLNGKNFKVPVFGPFSVLNENESGTGIRKELNELEVVAPYDTNDPSYQSFRKEFVKAFSKSPGPAACYAYDGMSMIIKAIRESGTPDYQKIKESLTKMDYKGVTGRIRFDDKGNRTGPCKLSYFINLTP